jgi:multiple sugar transport system substrate-binding protein
VGGIGIALLASACSSGGSPASTTAPAASPAAPTTAPTVAANPTAANQATTTTKPTAAAAPSAGRVTVTFTVPGGQAENSDFKPVFDAFAKEYPNIDAQYAPFNTGYTPEYMQKLLTSIAGNVAPDVFKINPSPYFGTLANQGTLYELDAFVKADSTIDFADYFTPHVEACQYKGKLYALPNDGAPQAMWYNVDVFKKEGIDLPTKDWTWENLLDAAKRLTKSSNGRPLPFGLGRPDWVSWVWSAGGDILNADGTQCLLDSPEAISALQWIQDAAVQAKVIPSPGDLAQASIDNLFTTGRLATTFGVRGSLGTYRDIKSFAFDAVQLPKGKKGRVGQLGIGYTSLWIKTKQPQASYTVAAFVAGKEGERLRISRGYAFPSRKSLVQEDWFQHYKTPKSASFAINTAFSDELFAGEARAWPVHPKGMQIQDALNKQIDFLWDGKKPAPQIARDMVAAVNDVLKG